MALHLQLPLLLPAFSGGDRLVSCTKVEKFVRGQDSARVCASLLKAKLGQARDLVFCHGPTLLTVGVLWQVTVCACDGKLRGRDEKIF